jgi:hypothetical protein
VHRFWVGGDEQGALAASIMVTVFSVSGCGVDDDIIVKALMPFRMLNMFRPKALAVVSSELVRTKATGWFDDIAINHPGRACKPGRRRVTAADVQQHVRWLKNSHHPPGHFTSFG